MRRNSTKIHKLNGGQEPDEDEVKEGNSKEDNFVLQKGFGGNAIRNEK